MMVYKNTQVNTDIMEKIARSLKSKSLYKGLTMEEQEYMRTLLRNKKLQSLPIKKLRKIAIAKARSRRRNGILSVLKYTGLVLFGALLSYFFLFFAAFFMAEFK